MSENGNTYNKALAGRIAAGVAACEQRGMTRVGISRSMGYQGAASLSKWTTGETTPGAENLAKLALATGLSLDFLVAGRGPMFPPEGGDALRLQVVGRVVDGQISEATIRKILGLSHPCP